MDVFFVVASASSHTGSGIATAGMEPEIKKVQGSEKDRKFLFYSHLLNISVPCGIHRGLFSE